MAKSNKKNSSKKEAKVKQALEIIDTYLGKSDWKVKENSNMGYSLQGMNNYISSEITKKYWLNKVYDKHIREAHEKGEMHIHDLGSLSSYTYFGKETVIAKLNGRILNISFEQLYDIVESIEILLNKEEEVWRKGTDNLEVLDKDGWVKVRKLIKKKKHRPMRFIKNIDGRSVIVTDNHPMITKSGEKMASEITKDDELYTVDIKKILENEDLFSIDKIDILKELKDREIYRFGNKKIYYNCIPIEEIDIDRADSNGTVHTSSNVINRFLSLDESFGFIIGFCLSDGMLFHTKENNEAIHISQKDKTILEEYGKKLFKKHGIISTINKRKKENIYGMRISNCFLKFVIDKIFNIRAGSYDKNLPLEHLKYSMEFNEGMVSGLIDGDATGAGTQITLRLVSRTMLEQSATLLNLMGFYVRDRGLDGIGSVREYKGRIIKQNYPIYGWAFRTRDIKLSSKKYKKTKKSTKCWRPELFNHWSKVLTEKETFIKEDYIYDITTESGTLVVNGMYNHNCCGWDLWDLLEQGFGGVSEKIESGPPSHFSSVLGQMNNFIFSLQAESAGAQAFSSFDTLLAPFIRKDKLTHSQIKQNMQEFIFNLNVSTRTGFQTPFSNLSFDLTVSPNYADMPIMIKGRTDWYLDENNNIVKKEDGGVKPALYKYFQKEVDLINKIFCEVMMEGDYKGRIFTFPIPTYNLTKDFDWDNPKIRPLFEITSKYGIVYFSNFINSDMKPEDVRSMCCRLKLDSRELRKRGGGLFGAHPLTGSIAVVTLNLPRIGYKNQENERGYFKEIDKLLNLARRSLLKKREILEDLTEKGMYPYTKHYLEKIKKSKKQYWSNHFNTIGILGMHESCLNMFGEGIETEKGKDFALKVLNHIREKLLKFQEEDGCMYNLEATPGEGTTYRFAKKDREEFGKDIIISGDGRNYYTNSTNLPVDYNGDIFDILEHQDEILPLYTGGSICHLFLGQRIENIDVCKKLVRKIAENFKLPYFTLSPVFSICPEHGYIAGEHYRCPHCSD